MVDAARVEELCDVLEGCSDLGERRRLYGTFTKEEQDAIIRPMSRRWTNRMAPVGSLVGPIRPDGWYTIRQTYHDGMRSAVHNSLAMVIGQVDDSYTRYLMLQRPWQDAEGHIMVFVEASAHELKVL
jgi:hypothetical protein